MRGGAIPLLVWGLILAVLYALIFVWTGKGLHAALAAAALVATFGTAFAFVALRPREALKKGEPPASEEPRAVASASYGAVLLGLGITALVYGLVFGQFLVYFGAGLIVVAIGVLTRENYAQRRALRRWRDQERP